jgi:hypothetical protein
MWDPHVRVIFNLEHLHGCPSPVASAPFPRLTVPSPWPAAHTPWPARPPMITAPICSAPRSRDLTPTRPHSPSLVPLCPCHGGLPLAMGGGGGPPDTSAGWMPAAPAHGSVLPPAARTTRSTAAAPAPCTSATPGTGCPGKVRT